MVSGLFRAGLRQRPGVADHPRRCQDGDDWVVNGQKVWTSFAQFSTRCVLLTRTAPGHDGITAFFVDMDTPGITIRPLRTMHGVDEFCEVYFDDVVIPASRMLGRPGDGWRLAMDLLPYERSTCFWQRIAYLYARFDELIAASARSRRISSLAQHISRCTRCAAGLGPPSTGWPTESHSGRRHSIDKVLAGHRRAAALRHRARPAARDAGAGRHDRGARNSCTRGRRPSMAAPPRSSATSSRAGCWTWARSERGHRHPCFCSKTACARR